VKQFVWQRHVGTEAIGRAIVDGVLLNIGLATALVLRYLWVVGVQAGPTSPHRELAFLVDAYLRTFPTVTAIGLIVFGISGFYARNRAYRGRHKALVTAQAVTVTYLIFVALGFVANRWTGFPRAAGILAWVISLALIVGARMASTIWRHVVVAEHDLRPIDPAARAVHNILVIGGDGYIGSALLPKLLERGYHVRVLSLLLYGREPIMAYANHPRLQIMEADFRQVDKVVEAMRGMDAVVHLGAIVGDPACALDEDLTIDINVTATKLIAEVAKGHGVNRFIFASTCSVYGASDDLLNEQSRLRPASLYASTKMACERILDAMSSDSFSVVSLRFGTIYGLSGRTRFDLVVNLLTARAVVEGEVTVSGGSQWRPFLHVEDAAAAVLRALEAPLHVVEGKVFNIGSDDQNFTIGEVGRLIASMVPGAKLVETVLPDADRRNYRVDFSQVRAHLGFRPSWTLEQGIRQVIDAVASGRVENYRDAKYSNVKFLNEQGLPSLGRPLSATWLEDLLSNPLEHDRPSEARSAAVN
jgi:nucleoside-diphosphate-sugar epimerase